MGRADVRTGVAIAGLDAFRLSFALSPPGGGNSLVECVAATPLQKRTFSSDLDPALVVGSFLVLRDGDGRPRFVTTMDPLVPRYVHVHGPSTDPSGQETIEVTDVPDERFSIVVAAISAVTTIELLGSPDELAQPVVDHLGLDPEGGTQLLASLAWPAAVA